MVAPKIEKALYGPSTTEVALGAVLGLISGLLVACVYLVFKPVQQVREMPAKDKIERGAIYYIPGTDSTAKGRSWSAKQKLFVAGNNVELVEDELNAWAAATFAAPAAGAKADEAKASADGGIFQPGALNIDIADGKIRIGFKCLLNWYGIGHEVFVITSGELQRSGGKFMFVPETVYLGSCPVHYLPGVPGGLVKHLLGKKTVPDELVSAWAKLSEVTIEGATLKLTAQ